MGEPRQPLNERQRWIIGIGAGLLLLLSIVVPWTATRPLGGNMRSVTSLGYGLIVSPPKAYRRIEVQSQLPAALQDRAAPTYEVDQNASVEVNVPMVLIPMGAVVLATIGGVIVAKQGLTAR